VYVSLKPPTTGDLYHTVVDVACRNAIGQTTENGTVDKIWGIFSGKNVNRWDGSGPLLYWGPFASDSDNNQYCATTGDLMKYGDGKCGQWSAFFEATLGIHGITSEHKTIRPKSPYCFIDIYAGLNAQGGTPQKRVFTNHAVSIYDNRIFDASYGASYLQEIDWEDTSVEGYSYPPPPYPDPVNDTKGVLETGW
jgi:hypothetical protein